MKFPNWLLTILFVFGGGIIGLLIALNTFPKPKWDKLVIPSNQKDLVEILFIDHNDFEEVQNDVIYVKSKTGDVYSIQYSEWSLLPSLPDKQIIQKINVSDANINSPIVATTLDHQFYQFDGSAWILISEFKEHHWKGEVEQCIKPDYWRHTPPVGENAIDSNGVVFEHTISGFFKCSILYEDGHLEVWSRASSGLFILWTAPLYSGIGIISGSLLSFIAWRYRKSRSNKELL
ncbi:MAG: hypothetical protein J0M11_23070 [Anaerolineae bacterium]|nr:hypothetical protein [Anaerolineae bacterium]